MIKLVSLTIDASVSTKLSFEQKIKLKQRFQMIQLDKWNEVFTSRIHNVEYRIIDDVEETSLFHKKKKVEAWLNCLKIKSWNHMIAKIRKRRFRNIDIVIFDAQFFTTKIAFFVALDTQMTKLIKYNIVESAEMIRLICTFNDDSSDRAKLRRKLQIIQVKATLCDRREIQRRDRFKSTVAQNKIDFVQRDDFQESYCDRT